MLVLLLSAFLIASTVPYFFVIQYLKNRLRVGLAHRGFRTNPRLVGQREVQLIKVDKRGGDAQISEEGCDSGELKTCVDMTPRTQVGLPSTREELDAHCLAYQTGMACMDAWIKRCLPTDGQKLVQQQIGGARALMRFLCTNDTALRRDFLKELKCWALVSPDWSRCVDELQLAVRDISERSHHIVYFNKNSELCCARDAFVSCVSLAGRACSAHAAHLLRRMAWVLAQDVAACNAQPRAHCAASLSHLAAPALAALSGATALLYPHRL